MDAVVEELSAYEQSQHSQIMDSTGSLTSPSQQQINSEVFIFSFEADGDS
jgi:hypothetical protein